MAKFTTSREGNLKLVDAAGYEYTKHSSDPSGIKIYWRCTKNKSLKCSARATTEGNYVVKNIGLHNH